MHLGEGYAIQLHGHDPQKGEWDADVGRSSSIWLKCMILSENPVADKGDQKTFSKSFCKFT